MDLKKMRCNDFEPINDGTLTGDYRFCNLSLFCKQVMVFEGKAVNCRSVSVEIDGTIDVLCTGYPMEKGEVDIEVI
jgi:hypothetical protein